MSPLKGSIGIFREIESPTSELLLCFHLLIPIMFYEKDARSRVRKWGLTLFAICFPTTRCYYILHTGPLKAADDTVLLISVFYPHHYK